ncbi:unnamed protein product [Plutella xylostella]|uniref:(diamondback moth) hypothetical protein n=1 Tax=Plutella xylostella TaxID=51655 RepID=A0A8S4G5J4_PLUXY|nr:unnamed protein product [Plutella xylostella]
MFAILKYMPHPDSHREDLGKSETLDCRNTQAVYDKCMLDKLQLPRPDFGYFCEARVHDTKRPKPLPEPKAVYPDATPALPEDYEKKPARFGSRFYWMTE